MESFHRHGGRLADARAVFSCAPEPWLDLSTGINPYPWPWVEAAGDSARLPDPALRAALEATAARAFGAQPEHVAAVPGADFALRILPYITKATHAAIASPTYGGHSEAWNAAGARVSLVPGKDLGEVDAGVVVVVNPNNPDGAAYSPAVLSMLADRQAANDGWLIVDESFADLMPDLSMIPQAHPRCVVLRSFGKFYGLPGLRLGFVVAAPVFLTMLRPLLGDWPVSSQAIAVGTGAYADAPWQAVMRMCLRRETAALDELLSRAGFAILGGTSLFRLVAHANARDVFRRLAEAGILVRPFADQPHWLRIGLPSRTSLNRLAARLEDL